ncbi:MAG TPA: efflux RND transporter periplasmic adaptor subunit [Dissulfurispiraceae bacterium]|nr:efflux RND transporter periplasmic adaptor subunit [Dissulfurispiraceae bacterium]
MTDAVSSTKTFLLWNRRLRTAIFCILFLVLISCSEKKAAAPQPTVPVTAAIVEQKAVPYEIRAIGNVVEYSSVNVRSQVGGYLSKIHFSKGQFVKKGAILFTIDPRSYQASLMQAEGALAKDEAQLANARSDERRYAELVKKGYISKQQYEQAEATAIALEAVVKADKAAVEYARVQLSYCYIHSPIGGRLGDILIDEGNLVKAADDNKYLVTIRQIQPIYVSFTVPERNLAEIKKYMASKELPVKVFFDKDDSNPENGVLTFIDNTVDPSTGTIKLKGTMKNENNRLWPGQFVNVQLSLYVQQDAVTIPTQAVQSGQTGQYVYVIKNDMTTEIRPVVIARTYGNDSVVEKGLNPGEQVVTDGQLRITTGAKVQIKETPDANAPKKGDPAPAQAQK